MEAGFVALGLVQGALAGLNALGFVLLWRTTRVINLAQPALGLVGGVLTGMLVASSGWSFWWAAPIGIATSALLGFASERLVIARLANLPRTVPMVATIGLAALFTALQSGIPFAFGGQLPSYDVDIGLELFVFPVLLKGPHLLALVSLVLVLAELWWFTHRTRTGTAALAVGQDLERAQALGVHAGYVRGIVWALAGTLSGIAGVLSIPVLGFSLGEGVGATLLLLGLAPAVLVGLRSFPLTAAASLAVGVGYQFALLKAPTAGIADVLLAALLIAALAVRRRPLEREAVARRASSWTAATGVARVPRRLGLDPLWRRLSWGAGAVLIVVAAIPPLWLTPSGDVRYGTGAALVLAAIASSAAWMFRGEIALGHWGIAALGATVTYSVSGPLAWRVIAGVATGVIAGLIFAVVARRRGGLAAAVAGLALATAAPYWLVRAGTPSLDIDGQTAAIVAGAVSAVAAVTLTWLRGRRLGLQMVAARDEPRRASGLGVATAKVGAAAMALSGGLAALAGILYLAAVPAGVAQGAFDATRSLDVLAFAVVGGLGSAVGAGLGAAALLVGGAVLPDPWGMVATGAGVVWVVLFAPAGLSSALVRLRDLAARALRPEMLPARFECVPPVNTDESGAFDEQVRIVAGADTREAMATPTVRAAMVAAFCVAVPTIASLFGLPMALDDHLGFDVGSFGPWIVFLAGATAVIAGLVHWRTWRARSDGGLSTEGIIAGVAAAALVTFVISDDPLMLTLFASGAPAVGGFVIAGLARSAAGVCVPRVRSAAAGLVVTSGVAGLIGSAHLAAVSSGNTIVEAARWAAVYLVGACLFAVAASARAPRDRQRSWQRQAAPAAGVRRRWAPLRVDSVTVDFDAHRVLDAVTLEVGSGEVIALVGTNGAGKSTLLRVVAGLTPPTTGRIDVAGQEITELRPDERASAGVAFVSGARPVFPELTVRENLRVGGYLTHRTNRSFEEALDHVLTLVPAFTKRLYTRAGLLSGGEQRQLAIAQTLFRRPTLLLADELTLGLDRDAQGVVLELLRTLADDGIGVVVVDHDLRSLAGIADRIAVLHNGSIVAFDDPASFREAKDDLLPARFLARSSR